MFEVVEHTDLPIMSETECNSHKDVEEQVYQAEVWELHVDCGCIRLLDLILV
jgi:hypothetical protein